MKPPVWHTGFLKWAWDLAAGCILFGLTAGCNLAGASTPGINVTQAYQTVSARLTQALETQAVQTLPPTASPLAPLPSPVSPTRQPATPESPLPSRTPTQTLVCDRAAAGNPIDITIPDDTAIQPGQPFTKIWRLQNVGSCTWTTEYGARFFYGAQMSAPEAVLLKGDVRPGGEIEIAVDMSAPQTPGVHQGNWKLYNASGQLFGIGPNGDAPFWVRIVVQQPPTATPTQTATPTPIPTSTASPTHTPTVTPTPPVQSGGALALKPGESLDLDTGELNPGSGVDLLYQAETSGLHQLLPQGSALLGVFGGAEPGLPQCQAATMSTAPLALESLPPGTYLCYQTDQNLIGWLRYNRLNADDGSAGFDYRTWALVP
jgi:septal ring-binding cell division protein DamX